MFAVSAVSRGGFLFNSESEELTISKPNQSFHFPTCFHVFASHTFVEPSASRPAVQRSVLDFVQRVSAEKEQPMLSGCIDF